MKSDGILAATISGLALAIALVKGGGDLVDHHRVASQSDLPTQATTTAYKLATVEARLDQCQEFHAAAWEAAWRWYGELSQCLGGTPTPEGVGR